MYTKHVAPVITLAFLTPTVHLLGKVSSTTHTHTYRDASAATSTLSLQPSHNKHDPLISDTVALKSPAIFWTAGPKKVLRAC
jgi:hypothetical protein